jgi:hypothetical protein
MSVPGVRREKAALCQWATRQARFETLLKTLESIDYVI